MSNQQNEPIFAYNLTAVAWVRGRADGGPGAQSASHYADNDGQTLCGREVPDVSRVFEVLYAEDAGYVGCKRCQRIYEDPARVMPDTPDEDDRWGANY